MSLKHHATILRSLLIERSQDGLLKDIRKCPISSVCCSAQPAHANAALLIRDAPGHCQDVSSVFVLSCYVSKFRGSRMPLHPEHGAEGGKKNSKKSGTKRSFSLKASHPHFSLEFQHQTFSGLRVFCVLWVEFNIKFSGSRKHWELYWVWNGLCEVYEIEVIHCYLFDV